MVAAELKKLMSKHPRHASCEEPYAFYTERGTVVFAGNEDMEFKAKGPRSWNDYTQEEIDLSLIHI